VQTFKIMARDMCAQNLYVNCAYYPVSKSKVSEQSRKKVSIELQTLQMAAAASWKAKL
jgi:hypothetical protein